MEHKILKMEIKDMDGNTGRFSGYAMVFNVVDSYNDITHPGAFKKTLRESKGRVPIFKMHQPTVMIGMGDGAKEDEHGLHFDGTLDIETNQTAREEFSLMGMAQKREVPFGQSIGYNAVKHDLENRRGVQIRNLREIALFEISTTPPNFQAVPGAVVGDLKYLSGADFDPDQAREWLRANAHIFDSIIENRDLILDIEDIERIKALHAAGVTTATGAAETSIEPDDIHSIAKAIEDLNKSLSFTGGK